MSTTFDGDEATLLAVPIQHPLPEMDAPTLCDSITILAQLRVR